MKKVTIIVLSLILAVMFVACSAAPDRQPAIDAYNKASEDFNAAAILINENIELIDSALVDKCNEMSDLLNTCYDKLDSEDELTQEKLDELTGWFETVSSWSIDTKEEIETGLAQLG